MKLLILGGTGVISKVIVKKALLAGMEVTIVNRGSKNIDFSGDVRTITADFSDREGFSQKMRDVRADTVINMICFKKAEAQQTMEVFRDKAEQIIFTSSVAAYERPYKSLPIREECETLSYDASFPYVYDKAEMERYLHGEMNREGAAVTIIRPSLTFGPGSRNFGTLRHNYNVVARMKAGKPLVLTGEAKLAWSFTYVEDLAQGFVLACGNSNTYNGHFHVVSDEIVTWEDLYNSIGEILGIQPKYMYIPSILLRDIDLMLMGHLYYEKMYASVFSTEKFRKAAPSFKCDFTLRQIMEKVVRSWEDDGLAVDIEKDALEDKMCECYGQFRDSLHALKTNVTYANSFK